MAFTTVILDVDDTLTMTEAVCFQLENAVLGSLGRPPMDRQVHLATWGQPLFEAILVRSPGVDVTAFAESYHRMVDDYVAAGKIDGITAANRAALDRLVRLGMRLAIVTSRTKREAEHLFEAPELHRVEAFYHKDNTAYHKPDGRVFDELLRDLQLQPTECVYVGDSVGDARACQTAGIAFIACLESGLRSKADFAPYAVWSYIDRFAQLPDTVMLRP